MQIATWKREAVEKLARVFDDKGVELRRLMTKMGLAPIYQRPKTSELHPRHRI